MLCCFRFLNIWSHFLEICMMLVDRVATKSMDSRGIGGGLQCDSDLVRHCMQIDWKCYPALESGIFGVGVLDNCMILVDWVATKSMDSMVEWGRISVRQRPICIQSLTRSLSHRNPSPLPPRIHRCGGHPVVQNHSVF